MWVDLFIRRPVLSGVISILIVLMGALSIPRLPVARYPELALPTVTVTAFYQGASSEEVESAVTIPLEQELNGVEGMEYFSSTSGNDGTVEIAIAFSPDRNIDLAAVDVQNRVSVASPRLPPEVLQSGILINKTRQQLLLAFGLFSPDGRFDDTFLSNYANVFIKDTLKRVKGVGDVRIFGERKFAMRLWLDPAKLAQRQLTAQDVIAALREQNIQASAGQVGSQPAPPGQAFQISVRAKGRLSEPEQFNELILKRGEDGALVRVSDIGRAELGAENYDSSLRFNEREAVGLGVFQLASANALDVRDGVFKEMARLEKSFPQGVQWKDAFDTTRAVEESIVDVVATLLGAIALVILVIFLFLHGLRALVIVAVTLPVSLIGTFFFIKAFGFTINTLTLFGLTLATGLVVDDAIVVIENIERQMRQGLSAMEAASKGMHEVAGAVIATSLVLVAVFVPVSFFPGTTGAVYRQFALTIAASISLSAVCALTLTPALCARLLRHKEKKALFFRRIDEGLDAFRRSYARLLKRMLRHKWIVLSVFFLCVGLTIWLYQAVPTGFIPNEDDGYFIVAVQGPEGSSLAYTREVLLQVETILRKEPTVQDIFSVSGFSVLGTGANYGVAFVNLHPWSERKKPDQSVDALVHKLALPLMGLGKARVFALVPPPIQGAGSFGGFQFVLQDRSGTASLGQMAQVTSTLSQRANQSGKLESVFSTFTADTPLLEVEVDRSRAKALGISVDQIYQSLQALMGSLYVNDFNFASRVYRVYVQADARFRNDPSDIGSFYVRSVDGQMVPLDSLVRVKSVTSAQRIPHYNLYRSTELNGGPAKGESSGRALETMEQLASTTLPEGYGYDWTGTSREEKEAGSQVLFIFGLAVVFVFLLLSAQYESFLLPFVIILSVPVAILGALAFQGARGLTNNVFCQVGLVMLVGLASKNAILIVEFAEQLRDEGKSAGDAVIEAAGLRLRPILMTSIAFLLGVVPLLIATGPGAAGRQSLGTAVFGGMLVSTAINLLVIPVIYVLLDKLRDLYRKRVPSAVTHRRHHEPLT